MLDPSGFEFIGELGGALGGAWFRAIAGPRRSAILKRIGAAVSLPLRPGIGVPSGRPAQTPIVTSGS